MSEKYYTLSIDEPSVPPPPNIPEPKPEMPPTKIPNSEPVPKPKDTTVSNEMPTETYTCKICGKTFNTQEELALHTETAHKSPKKT